MNSVKQHVRCLAFSTMLTGILYTRYNIGMHTYTECQDSHIDVLNLRIFFLVSSEMPNLKYARKHLAPISSQAGGLFAGLTAEQLTNLVMV